MPAVPFALSSLPADVPTSEPVRGSGIVGGVLREANRDLYEPLGLGSAVPVVRRPCCGGSDLRLDTGVYRQRTCGWRASSAAAGLAAEIIPLNGSAELAPAGACGPAHRPSTPVGRPRERAGHPRTIMESQATLVVNRASHRLAMRRCAIFRPSGGRGRLSPECSGGALMERSQQQRNSVYDRVRRRGGAAHHPMSATPR